jgi:uncharacterized hydrophobic protein (TIGR00271 family)
MEESKASGQTPEPSTEESGEQVKQDFKGLWQSIRIFLTELLDIRGNTDKEATKEAIIADIPFKGHTAWILVCSIFIASVGLNANSTAVVIGAMLISPLMGPILGLGLSLAINDIDTLRRSLNNLAVMVVLSVITSFLFFYFFPLQTESSELLARTKPDIRDVLIAFFGGLALVIARAKKGTIASVIFGVAIATALMPPLCTVGFGLAIGNFEYAGGALLLFGINTIFIALATFLVIILMRFPMVRYANSKRRRLIARLVSVAALAVMIPSGYIFYQVFQEFLFKKQANEFIMANIETYKFSGEGRYLDNLTELKYNNGKMPSMELVFMGNDNIPDNVISTWEGLKNKYSKLRDTELRIIQGSKNEEVDQLKYVQELYESKKAELLNKDEKIRLLEAEVTNLDQLRKGQIPFKDISEEAKANYQNLASLGYAREITTDFTTLDTLSIFEVEWKEGTTKEQKVTDADRLADWLKIRIKDTTLQLRERNN